MLADALQRLATIADEFRGSLRDRSPIPVSNFPVGEELRASYTFGTAEPRGLERILTDVSRWMETGILQVTHPRYFGLFNPSVHASSIIADALVALYNPQMGGWSHSPAANEIEQWTLGALAETLGWPRERLAAHYTSGGSEANHTAVLAALADRAPEYCTGGTRALAKPPRIYVSDESHHSFVKIARACGLGEDALAHVATDSSFRMRPDALLAAIERDEALGMKPLMVVATAGTTGSGAIEPMSEVADIALERQMWMHVDAAWGGSAALVPRLRPHLAGIELADSVTWDAHKMLSVSMGAGMFFCKHRAALQRMFEINTGYVPPTVEGGVDLYKESLQWSRRFIGLKVFFAIAEHGMEGLGRIIERQAATADLLRERLRAAGWRIVNDTPLPLVCFTHGAIDGQSLTTQNVVDRVLARGRCWISHVKLPRGTAAVRACITSFDTNDEDIDVLLEDLALALSS
ncbi:MAG TPA: pyridoxal-dependent decarboxylase [Gemmatimonadaceae bacterium]|nr:pyridoxal-dependent decarboxylase [Gemmatimonadaceae bacterium]